MYEKFCPDCLDYTSCESFSQETTYNVRGEDIVIKALFLRCLICHEIVPDGERQEHNFNNVYHEYRQRKNLLQPSEIKEIRENYGLSQRQFAKILGWGHATLSRYEGGALQSTNHNNELVLLKQPYNMMQVLQVNSNNLAEDEYKKIEDKILKVHEVSEQYTYRSLYELSTKNGLSILNGYRRFDYERLLNTVKFFAKHDYELWKVKLMKYLFYSDFLHFKKYTISLNGLRYVNFKMGPVVEEYDKLLLALLTDEQGLKRDYVFFENSEIAGELFTAADDFDASIFSDDELSTLETVLDYVKPHTSGSISTASHQEDAWSKTRENDLIPYEYAQTLSLN